MYFIKLTLRPGAQFHLGNAVPFVDAVLHDTDEFIHSDTLYSAFMNIGFKIGFGNAVKKALESSVQISSAFYLLENKNGQPICFLPRPTLPLLNPALPYKEIKKIKFVSKGIFEKSIPYEELNNNKKVVTGNNWIALKEEIYKLLDEGNEEKAKNIKLFDIVNLPQVCVHTDKQENKFYQVGNLRVADNQTYFNDLNVCFYFLLNGELSPELKMIINLLPHEGIGGQRSTGCGLFESVEIKERSDFENFDGERKMTLSLIHPTANDQDALNESAFYKTLVRGGRILWPHFDQTPEIRLKQVYMLSEGAVFSQPPTGNIVSISQGLSVDHEYLRYGKAFLINIPKTLSYV
jgi:CRISPR-associated protein Csm4